MMRAKTSRPWALALAACSLTTPTPATRSESSAAVVVTTNGITRKRRGITQPLLVFSINKGGAAPASRGRQRTIEMSRAHPDFPVLPSGEHAPEEGRAVSVGSGDWFASETFRPRCSNGMRPDNHGAPTGGGPNQMKTHEQKLSELRAASAQLSARRETEFAAIDEAIATHRAADPDHGISWPMDNQEAAANRRIAVTAENVAACAQAIRDFDRVTPRPLTAEDQARAVLTFLANTADQRRSPE